MSPSSLLSLFWVAPLLTRCQSGLKRRTLKAAVGSYQKAWASPQEGSGAMSIFRCGGEDLLLQGPSALMSKAPNQQVNSRLSRVALLRTLHGRSVDKRRTLIQVESKST